MHLVTVDKDHCITTIIFESVVEWQKWIDSDAFFSTAITYSSAYD